MTKIPPFYYVTKLVKSKSLGEFVNNWNAHIRHTWTIAFFGAVEYSKSFNDLINACNQHYSVAKE